MQIWHFQPTNVEILLVVETVNWSLNCIFFRCNHRAKNLNCTQLENGFLMATLKPPQMSMKWDSIDCDNQKTGCGINGPLEPKE